MSDLSDYKRMVSEPEAARLRARAERAEADLALLVGAVEKHRAAYQAAGFNLENNDDDTALYSVLDEVKGSD